MKKLMLMVAGACALAFGAKAESNITTVEVSKVSMSAGTILQANYHYIFNTEAGNNKKIEISAEHMPGTSALRVPFGAKCVIVGPGTLTFAYRVSSEPNDVFSVSVDNVQAFAESGLGDWTVTEIRVEGDGAHKLKTEISV